MNGCEVGTAEWTRDPDDQAQDHDLYVEVSVDGGRRVVRTMFSKTPEWDQELTMCVDQLC